MSLATSEPKAQSGNQAFNERFDRRVACPWCESQNTRVSSPFGGTVSEILFTCNHCHQSFGFMKWDEQFQEDL